MTKAELIILLISSNLSKRYEQEFVQVAVL